MVAAMDMPCVKFHALRHSHASALIASGLDVLTVSRRLGHGSPVEKAEEAIEAALRTTGER